MRRKSVGGAIWVLAVLVLIGGAAPGWAQDTNLSGQWVFVEEKSSATPTVPRIFNTTGAPAGSNELLIEQSPEVVTITIGGVVFAYRLDGNEANVSAEGRAGFPVGKAAWEGDRLMVTLVQEVFSAAKLDYVKVPLSETYTVSDGMLTVRRTRTHLDGTTTSEELVYTAASS